jgi:hypothetical protein
MLSSIIQHSFAENKDMGTIRVRVENTAPLASEPKDGVRGEVKEIGRGRRGLSRIVPLDTDQLAASLKDLTGELGKIFADLQRFGGYELNEVQVGLEISAEGGFNLIGNAKAGGKGAITLTFAPGRNDAAATHGEG